MPHHLRKFHCGSALLSVVIGTLSLTSLVLGLRVLLEHKRAPVPLTSFPAQSALFLASDKPTLVLLARSSSAEARDQVNKLACVMSQSEGNLKAYMLFEKTETDLWRDAAAIPGVTPVGDDDGSEISRFGTGTDAFLFANDGHILYRGTVTQPGLVAIVKSQRNDRAFAANNVSLK